MKSVQFNLRQLLTAVLICSIVFAISAPFLRLFPEKRQIWMGLTLVAGATAFCLALLRLVYKRHQLEIAAGKILLPLHQPPRSVGRVLAFAAALEVLIIATMAIGGTDSIGTFIPMLLAVCVAPTWSKVCILYAWHIGEETLELCENGVIVGGLKLYAWRQVISHAWRQDSDPAVLWLFLDDQLIAASVPLLQRPDVESLLAAKAPPDNSSDALANASG